MATGLISVSKASVQSFLDKGPGHAVVIVIGGAAEALCTPPPPPPRFLCFARTNVLINTAADAKPGTTDLTLRERKGFVKLAIKEG